MYADLRKVGAFDIPLRAPSNEGIHAPRAVGVTRSVSVQSENLFGVFLFHEIMMLCNVPVHKTARETGVTRQSIYTSARARPLPGRCPETSRSLGVALTVFNPHTGVPWASKLA